ncbi:RelB/DinJ family addiction module antitoxin [Lacticaseibacillus pabuli]|uniref:RelB/DinJ family addiction module antitoxin n=1 Tax=Lacticaseibacillus pabuli TaxID=3025672 RepID=A0ABY7WQN2_9LACO|nr:RelB/DinJ family addiction module antitoxin [Lacticaseibacillus sp. KACC 23028]WDF82498.1 RelB/DinJ family addiction module antitoxin [Lacticaseibacillus sp. KACC 23028]
MDKPQKKLQVIVDAKTDKQVRIILNQLGLNPSVVIGALWKRIAAEGGIPFSLMLTNRELANDELSEAVFDSTVPIMATKETTRDYLLNGDDDDY